MDGLGGESRESRQPKENSDLEGGAKRFKSWDGGWGMGGGGRDLRERVTEGEGATASDTIKRRGCRDQAQRERREREDGMQSVPPVEGAREPTTKSCSKTPLQRANQPSLGRCCHSFRPSLLLTLVPQ